MSNTPEPNDWTALREAAEAVLSSQKDCRARGGGEAQEALTSAKVIYDRLSTPEAILSLLDELDDLHQALSEGGTAELLSAYARLEKERDEWKRRAEAAEAVAMAAEAWSQLDSFDVHECQRHADAIKHTVSAWRQARVCPNLRTDEEGEPYCPLAEASAPAQRLTAEVLRLRGQVTAAEAVAEAANAYLIADDKEDYEGYIEGFHDLKVKIAAWRQDREGQQAKRLSRERLESRLRSGALEGEQDEEGSLPPL